MYKGFKKGSFDFAIEMKGKNINGIGVFFICQRQFGELLDVVRLQVKGGASPTTFDRVPESVSFI